MAEIDNNIKYGMVEAISHLIHRDYEAIVYDFVTLEFIPPGTNLSPILPVLSNVFDQALEGGGAKSINFQDLAGDLAQITFDYPFRIPPYFALIIRAIGVLEGIALVGDPDFAIVDEAYPYLSKMLLTDKSERSREALRYTLYGNGDTLQVERLIDILQAFDAYRENLNPEAGTGGAGMGGAGGGRGNQGPGAAMSLPTAAIIGGLEDMIVDEVAATIDALTRQQLWLLVERTGLQRAFVPVLFPGVVRPFLPIAPRVTDKDRILVDNLTKLVAYLVETNPLGPETVRQLLDPTVLQLGAQSVPKVTTRLLNRITARTIREVFTL